MSFTDYCTESEKQWLFGFRLVVSASAIYPRDRVADWEPGLTAAAQHCERIVLHITIPGKIKTLSMVSVECVSLLHHHKVKKS